MHTENIDKTAAVHLFAIGFHRISLLKCVPRELNTDDPVMSADTITAYININSSPPISAIGQVTTFFSYWCGASERNQVNLYNAAFQQADVCTSHTLVIQRCSWIRPPTKM